MCWFDANCNAFRHDFISYFTLIFITNWLSVYCKLLENGVYFGWERLPFWIYKALKNNCKYSWQMLTHLSFPPIMPWKIGHKRKWYVRKSIAKHARWYDILIFKRKDIQSSIFLKKAYLSRIWADFAIFANSSNTE